MTSRIGPPPDPGKPPAHPDHEKVKAKYTRVRKMSQTMTPEQIKALMEAANKKPEPPK